MTLSLKPSYNILCRRAAEAACALLLVSCSADIDEPEAAFIPAVNREVVTFTTSGTVGATASRYTGTTFENGDMIFIYAYTPGGLPSGLPKQYLMRNGVFEPMSYSATITKEPGETLQYIAQTVQRTGEQWRYPAGDTSYYDVLFFITESASTTVALDFIHLMSLLNVTVKGLASSQKIRAVELLDIHQQFEINLAEDAMSVYGPKLESVSMGKIDQTTYCYYAPPMHFIQAYTDFIQVTLTSGKFYKFYLTRDVMLDNNHAYFWEVDLSSATPSNAPSANAPAATGNTPDAAPAHLVRSESLTPTRPVILNNK